MVNQPKPANGRKPYKYRLKELFIAVFGSHHRDMRKQFSIQYNICYRQVSRDFNRLIDNPEPIPTHRLIQYAHFLNVEPSQIKHSFHQKLSQHA